MEENYIKLIAEINHRSMSNSHRLDDIESNTKLMMEICSDIKLLAQRQELLTEEIKDLKKDIIGIKEKRFWCKETQKAEQPLIVLKIMLISQIIYL